MKRLLGALAALALTVSVASAQAWSRTFEHTFSRTRAIATHGDEAWVVSGSALLHLDASGSVLGEFTIQPRTTDVQIRPDGGRALCSTLGGWIGSYAASHHLEWAWNVDPTGYAESAEFYGLDITADGGVVAIGNRWFNDAGYEDEWGELMLYRFGPDGTVLWSLRAGDFADRQYTGGTDVVELADGTFFFVGRTGLGPTMTCGRVSATGQLLWFDQVADSQGWQPRVALLADGDLLAIDGASLVLRMNADGDVAWKKRITGTQRLYGLAATPDGGAVATGYVLRPGNSSIDLLHLKLGGGGAIEWQGTTGTSEYQFGYDVAVAANGDLLVAGSTASSFYESVVQRFDAQGQSSGCDVVPASVQLEPLSSPNTPVGDAVGPAPDPLVPNTTSVKFGDLDVVDVCLSLSVGTRYCAPAVANSTGSPAEMWVSGEASKAANAVLLVGDTLPPNQVGYFLVGMGIGVVNPPGSQGNLCLIGSSIYRFASSAKSAGGAGVIALAIDLKAIPGLGEIQSGETWNFQAWYRDQNPQNTSNFTDAVAVTFLP